MASKEREFFMTGIIFKALAACGVVAAVNGADMIHFQQGDPKTEAKGNITFWSQEPGAKIEHIKEADGSRVARLTGTSANAYLTPMINLKPIKVTNKTVLSFELKCQVVSFYQINLTNGVENAWYRLSFEAGADQWVSFRKYIAGSWFSRNLGKESVINDGMLGDPLIRVQIEAKGMEVLLRNFKIYESAELVEELPPLKAISRAGYELKRYPRFDRGGIFPFGIISTVKAGNEKNGKYFSQSTEERREKDMLTARRLGFNTYCNFMDESLDVSSRLKAAEKYDLYLMDTAAAYLDYLGDSDQMKRIAEKYDSEERLIAWYGRDEPTDLEKYADWKIMVNQHSPSLPFTSALDNPYKIKVLGNLMEIVMPDIYPLTVTSRTPAHDIATKTGAQIRLSRESCGTGKVWTINQAYSLRRNQDNDSSFLLRYPEPVEIRFDLFNSLAAGAEGIIYFILNDEVPFLDGCIRREEFDNTLVDAWYNTNPTSMELAALGRDIVPVASALMRAEEIAPYEYSESGKLVRRATKNEFGRYYYVVNANLSASAEIPFNPDPAPGDICVDLVSLRKVDSARVNLAPGYGAIVMVGTPENVNRIATEIRRAKAWSAIRLAELENTILEQAGQTRIDLDKEQIAAGIERNDWKSVHSLIGGFFSSLDELGGGDSDYAKTGRSLEEVRKLFGSVNDNLVQPERIKKYDGRNNPSYEKCFEELKELSKSYFELYRNWRNGAGDEAGKVEALKTKVENLRRRISLADGNK